MNKQTNEQNPKKYMKTKPTGFHIAFMKVAHLH